MSPAESCRTAVLCRGGPRLGALHPAPGLPLRVQIQQLLPSILLLHLPTTAAYPATTAAAAAATAAAEIHDPAPHLPESSARRRTIAGRSASL